MKLIWWMMAALGAATVAGCTVGPDYQAPVAAVPAEWSRTGMGAEPAHQADWWVTLQDPILTALEERAAQANLDLRLAAARVREARAARGIADASRLPMVGAQGGYTRTRLSPDSPIGPLIPNPNFGDWVAGFDASWELDLFGRVRRSVEAADAELAATEEGARDVLVTVQAEVARDYIELRSAQQRLGIAEGTLASERDTLDLVQERSRAGLAADFDVTRAQAETSATEAELPRLREEITESVYAMGVLLGREPNALAEELRRPAPIPAVPERIAAGLPTDLLRRRPDIRQAERRLAAENARIGVAEADYFPRFDLKAGLGIEATRLAPLGEINSQDYSVGPSFGWAIFAAGKIRNHVRAQDAKRDEAEVAFEQSVLSALREVETALARYAAEAERRQALEATAASDRRTLELARERYRQGATDLLGVLDAQRLLFAARDALAQSYQATATDWVALYKSLGGGWEDPSGAPLARANPSAVARGLRL
jgi:NodT family efflux transporter outer membrane factor (OMF) lipoprotein